MVASRAIETRQSAELAATSSTAPAQSAAMNVRMATTLASARLAVESTGTSGALGPSAGWGSDAADVSAAGGPEEAAVADGRGWTSCSDIDVKLAMPKH